MPESPNATDDQTPFFSALETEQPNPSTADSDLTSPLEIVQAMNAEDARIAGAVAVGRNTSGDAARASGWGHILGDEGSGYDIGRCALTAATRAADRRGEPTVLLARILCERGLTEASALLGSVYHDEDKAARLAPLILRAAWEGDRVAGRIVHRAAELALAVITVGSWLGFRGRPLPLALGGGQLIGDREFGAQMVRRVSLRQRIGQLVIVEEPALSAAPAAAVLVRSLTRDQR